MGRVILIVAKMMLPEPALPDPALGAQLVAGPRNTAWQAHREPRLDQTPAGGVVAIPPRHRPYRMQMIGQNDPCIDLERPLRPRAGDRPAPNAPPPPQQTHP